MVITSALHAEGREFEPRQNLSVLTRFTSKPERIQHAPCLLGNTDTCQPGSWYIEMAYRILKSHLCTFDFVLRPYMNIEHFLRVVFFIQDDLDHNTIKTGRGQPELNR